MHSQALEPMSDQAAQTISESLELERLRRTEPGDRTVYGDIHGSGRSCRNRGFDGPQCDAPGSRAICFDHSDHGYRRHWFFQLPRVGDGILAPIVTIPPSESRPASWHAGI